MRRKALGLAGFASGVLAGSVLYRRTVGRRRARVDVYFADGGMITWVEGSPEAGELLPVAAHALAAARAT
ncbi:MAG: hypothetical protein ACRDL2_13185 [Gaiellaceae bacterium]